MKIMFSVNFTILTNESKLKDESLLELLGKYENSLAQSVQISILYRLRLGFASLKKNE